jgi:hypothetical protein
MFGMSLADICGSIAMALTSLPMPSYMPKEEIFGYKWAGTRLGNTYTCNAQGFFAFFGMGCMFNYNAMLCVYYACAIAFTMRERNIKRYVEPLLHGLPILAGLSFSVPPLFFDMYNPGISAFAWCGPQTYPIECNLYQGVECIRGNPGLTKQFQFLIFIVIVYVFCIIFISLGMVIWKVLQTDRVMVHISRMYCKRGYSDMAKVLEKHTNTKAAVIQASCYILAFLLGVLPPLLLSVGAVDNSGSSDESIKTADIFEKLTLVFLPLQGFFNFIIFLSHKVYNYRRVRRDVSIGQVIAMLFSTSAHDPCFISRISIVMKNEDDRANDVEGIGINQQHQIHDLNVKDESNDELHYRLGLMNDNLDIDRQVDSETFNQNGSGTCVLVQEQTFSHDDTSKDPLPHFDDNASTTFSKNGDAQSCFNGGANSFLSFASRSSFTNNSLWQRDLSFDEEEPPKK